MTLQSSGPISISNISTEIGQSTNFSTSLNFLNGLITPGQSAGSGTGGTGVAVASQRPANPNMNAFYGKTYYKSSQNGNCANGNCNCSGNCGNRQCNQCYSSQCVNCANCDTQAWLQSGGNCACNYNCNANQTSFNCNCACDCSKIVCAKFHDMGMMSSEIWAADQAYGRVLRKRDKTIYRGYIKWAKICTQWMDGAGPDFMPWIADPTERKLKQKEFATDILYRVGQPWSEHMAYIMGTLNKDNDYGRILMSIGRPLCKFFGAIPRMPRRYRKHGFFTSWTILSLLYFSYYAGKAILKLKNLFNGIKENIMQEASK